MGTPALTIFREARFYENDRSRELQRIIDMDPTNSNARLELCLNQQRLGGTEIETVGAFYRTCDGYPQGHGKDIKKALGSYRFVSYPARSSIIINVYQKKIDDRCISLKIYDMNSQDFILFIQKNFGGKHFSNGIRENSVSGSGDFCAHLCKFLSLQKKLVEVVSNKVTPHLEILLPTTGSRISIRNPHAQSWGKINLADHPLAEWPYKSGPEAYCSGSVSCAYIELFSMGHLAAHIISCIKTGPGLIYLSSDTVPSGEYAYTLTRSNSDRIWLDCDIPYQEGRHFSGYLEDFDPN